MAAWKELQCPFMNKKCIETKCAMWVEMTKSNTHTGESWRDDGCGVARMVPVITELMGTNVRVQAAVESLRNQTVARQDAMLEIVTNRELVQMPNEG